MHFKTYLKNKLEQNNIERSALIDHLNVNRSTICSWLNGRRFPEHDLMIKTIGYFSKSKQAKANDLYFIFYGDK